MDRGHIGLVRVCFPIELCGDYAGVHGWNDYLLGGTDHVHFGIDLSRVHIVDQLVAVHKVDANDIVVQLGDYIHWMSEFSSFDPEVHLIDPYGVHCISGYSNATLSVRDLLQFLGSKCGIK